MAGAGAQDDLEGVVVAGGEEDAAVGPIGEGTDAQQKLGPIGDAGVGQDGLTPILQGRPVVEDEIAGIVVGGGGLEQGQQGVPDPELHGLVPRAVAVGQDVEAQDPRRRVGSGRDQGQQGKEGQGGQEDQDRSFHGDSMDREKVGQTFP